MKNFELTSQMQTISGVFYPKGYAVIMFEKTEDAEKVAHEWENRAGNSGDSKSNDSGVMLLSPPMVLRHIGRVEGESDVELPSVGTEGATVRKYVDLARAGHCALMVKVGSDKEVEALMTEVRKVPFSYGQRYHLLAMRDLE